MRENYVDFIEPTQPNDPVVPIPLVIAQEKKPKEALYIESGSELPVHEEIKQKEVVKIEVKEESKSSLKDNEFVACRVVSSKKILDKTEILELFCWYGVREGSIQLSRKKSDEATVLFSSQSICEKACIEKQNDLFELIPMKYIQYRGSIDR